MTGRIPDDGRAKDVDRPPPDDDLAVVQHGRIGQVHRQLRVVAIDDAAQEERPCRAEADSQPGQKPRVLVVEPEFSLAPQLEVAEAIEHGKRVPMLENVGAIVHAGRRRQDVELILDLDDFLDYARHSSAPVWTVRATSRS